MDREPQQVRDARHARAAPARRHAALPQPVEPSEGLARRPLRWLDRLHAHLLRRVRADAAPRPQAVHALCLLEQLVPLCALSLQGAEAGGEGGGRRFGVDGVPGRQVVRCRGGQRERHAAREAARGPGRGRFYTTGPGPRWGEADRLATQAFQRAQGWTGANADGLPGSTTWAYLVGGKGKDIPPVAGNASRPGSAASKVPPYPGRGMFRPGASNAYVTQLGRQLVKKGFGKSYTNGPAPLGRDRPAGRRGVPAVPGLARRRGRRLPGARDLATALLVNAHRPAAGGA